MQLLSQSAFLQALGYAIAGSLWQAALLWLLVAGISGVFKFSAQVKYKMAMAAQFGAFVWFVVTLQFYYTKCSEAIALIKSAGLNNANTFVYQPGTQTFTATLMAVMLKAEKLLPYLSVAYIALLVVLAIRWINGYRQTTIIKTQGLQKIDVEWRLFVKKIAGMLNIKHPVSIYVSELVKSPLTVGFLKPLILIPLASINNLTTYQLEAVILHELAHIKRADYLVNIILSIIEISLFFNPFIQLLGKITKRERENSCDDWVLQFQYDASAYAEALLRIAYMQQPALAMSAAGKDADLLTRVKRMLNQKQKSFQYRNRLLALVLITGMLSSVAWFTPPATAPAKTVAKQQTVVAEPLAIKVDNPLFNPLSFLNKPLKEEVTKAEEDAKISLQDAAKNMAGTVITEVVPKAMDQVKAININMPDILSSADGAVTNVMTMAGLDKDTAISVWNTAKAGIKNVDWTVVNKGIDEAKKAVSKELADNKDLKNLKIFGLDRLITKSLASVNFSASKAKDEAVSDEDNNGDEEDNTIMLSSPSGAAKATPGLRIRMQTKEQIRLEMKRKQDSLRKVSAYLKKLQQYKLGDLDNEVAIAYDDYSPVTKGYTGVYNYQLAGYEQTKAPVTYTWTKDGDIKVTGTAGTTLVAVKEEKDTDNSYQKKLTIETMDTKGQRHVFHITVEMYQ